MDEAKGMSRPVYRGQAKATWQLLSGAVDRLQKAYGTRILEGQERLRELVSDYHKELLVQMEVVDSRRAPDLQQLSILQHQGAATGLLDFTESPLVALWFACEDEPEEDGRVFMLDIDDHQVANGRKLENQKLIGMERIVYYEPDRSLGSRIVAQQSVFVICNPPQVAEDRVRSVVVPKEAKELLTEYLARVGLSELALFGDVPGLARANARHKPLRTKETHTPEQFRDRGKQAYRVGRYDDALAQYQLYAAALPDVAQPCCLIGDTLSALGRYEEAIEAYTRAIERRARPMDFGHGVIVHAEAMGRHIVHALYFNRGNAHAAAGNHAQAVSDYDSALRHGSELRRNVLFNRGNSKYSLERFVEAVDDFEAVWSERQGGDAALALGNCKVMTGELTLGLLRYLDGVGVAEPEGSAAHCRQNAEHLQQILDVLGESDYEVRREGHIVYVEAAGEVGVFPFAGNRGNAGNTPSGMVTSPGGKGYAGSPGFTVITEPKRD